MKLFYDSFSGPGSCRVGFNVTNVFVPFIIFPNVAEIVKKVAGDYQELTQALDATRHKIHLTNIHSIEREALADEWKHLMDQAAVASAQVQPGNLKEIVQGAAVVSRLDDSSKNQIQLLDQYVPLFFLVYFFKSKFAFNQFKSNDKFHFQFF
jgi:hypothetical protein